jgi:hypothetical protein
MVLMPLRPALIPSQLDFTVLPSGETMPRPVMTTRRLLKAFTPVTRIHPDGLGRFQDALTKRAV